METLDDLFEVAKLALKNITALGEDLPKTWPVISVGDRLASYAYYKQATKGACPEETQPASWDKKSVAGQKWIAWKKLGDMTKDEAKASYCRLTIGIVSAFQSIPQQEVQTYLANL
ncbi:hypothetical protein HDU91_002255, partial [Kappamyces sp. JEL0680]